MAKSKKTTKKNTKTKNTKTKTAGKGTKPKADAKTKTPAKDEALPFGVAELAKALNIEPASARIRLRNSEIAKAGKAYGWKNQKDFDAVVKKLSPKTDKKAA